MKKYHFLIRQLNLKIDLQILLMEVFSNHKTAFIITLSLFVIITAAIIIVPKMLMGISIAGADFNAMLDLKSNLEKDYPVSNVGVQSQVYQRRGSDGGVEKSTNLIISRYLKYSTFNDKDVKAQLYEQINNEVVSTYPNIENYDNVVSGFRTGYNLGIGNKISPSVHSKATPFKAW